ncbi:unnamed protein product [Arabis nemorensis]|uniref:S-protein homolog n=1 Tax=Arabis nemorensis TaxID=586526 RepID=A0A565ANT8_9BRAS|nr:unnamed protein product [Arabis nemorensis]
MIDNVYGNPFKGERTTILIRNSLSYNKWLKAHCKSGNNDMGVRYLKPQQDYDFGFRDNVLGNTLFWCSVSKGPDYRKSTIKFEAYKQDKGEPHGGSYNYLVKEDGIYHSNFVDFKLKKVYSWN